MGIIVGIASCVGNMRAVATAPVEVEPTGIMTFADPAMQALCAKTWGDGTNITYEQARAVTEIPNYWADRNTKITSFDEIKYFKNCTSIGQNAFSNCTSLALTSLELPKCTSIGAAAFQECRSMKLTSLKLPQCTTIGGNAFNGCSSMALTKLELPQCTTIGHLAFQGCSSMALTSLELPQCRTIGSECFASTKGIGKLNWGELAKNVVNEGFRNIKGIGIPIVNIPNITAWFESTFGYVNASPAIYSHNLCQNDVPMPDVVIPEGCTKIGQKTLCYLHLNSLSIPETVTSIGDFNQYALQLPVFDIPSSVNKIGQYVIGGNYDSNVKNVPIVICRATTPPRLGTVKANNGTHQAIYVPDESVEAYKTATNWNAFADIILPLSQFNG